MCVSIMSQSPGHQQVLNMEHVIDWLQPPVAVAIARRVMIGKSSLL